MTVPQIIKRILCGLAVVVLMIPLTVALQFIGELGVNTVVLDDFNFVHLFEKFLAGTLTLADLTEPHNDHRFFFGRLMMLALGVPTKLNILVQLYASWTFVFASGIVLALLFVKVFRSVPRALIALVPVSFMLFNLKAYEVFLFGITFTNSMMMFFVFLTLYQNYLLQESKVPWLRLCFALASALVASFTGFAGGLVVWPIGFFQLAVMLNDSSGYQRQRFKYMTALWIAFFGLSIFLHRLHLPLVLSTSASGHSERHLDDVCAFALTLFGSPFCADVKLMQVLGGATIVLCLVVIGTALRSILLKRGNSGLLLAVCIAFFDLLVQLLIIYGRAVFFEAVKAMSPRYARFAYIALSGMYLAVLCNRGMNSRLRNSILVVVLGLSVCGVTTGYANAYAAGIDHRDLRKRMHTISVRINYNQMKLFGNLPFSYGCSRHALRNYVTTYLRKDKSTIASFRTLQATFLGLLQSLAVSVSTNTKPLSLKSAAMLSEISGLTAGCSILGR